MKRRFPLLIALLLAANSGSVVMTQARVAERQADGATGGVPDVAPRPRRVLALYSEASDHPVNVSFDRQFHAVLRRQSGYTVEHYTEFFETTRFPGEAQAQIMYDYLRRKYAGRKIDVLFAWGPFTLPFLLEYRTDLFSDTPIVYYSGTLSEFTRYPPPPMTGVLNPDTYERTLDVALRLHPDTTDVFVISGTPTRDKATEREVSRQLEQFQDRVRFTYLTDLPLDRLIAAVKSVPKRSIIIYSRQEPHQDDGKVLELPDYVDLVSRSASAPVYGPFRSSLGYGTVGGVVDDLEAGATKAAEIVLRVASGVRPQDIPADRTPRIPTFDARQLKRWGISEDRLPPGSVILFREPTIWGQYRHYIVGTGIVLGVQTVLIGALLVQRARRRRVELALRESEERFRVMADTAPVMIWRSRADNERDFFNKPWLDFRGRAMDDQAGSGWTNGVHPDDLAAYISTSTSAFDERRPFRMEYRLQRADGEYRWVLDSGVPRFTPDGAFAGYIGSCVDITERKRAEEALQQSERRYALATAAGSVTVWDWQRDTRDTNAASLDPALNGVLGLSDHEAGNDVDAWRRCVHPDDASRLAAAVQACIDGRTVRFETEYRRLNGDGGIRWFVARGSAVCLPDGQVVKMIGTNTDTTERKRAEDGLREAQEELARVSRLTALGEFAASIAHEVSQPLNAILMNASICVKWMEAPSPPADEVRSALRDIAHDSNLAKELMRRNRALFQHHTVEMLLLDINSVIREVANIARAKLQDGEIALEMTLGEDLPAIRGDRIELQQALLNLIVNAIDAMEGVDVSSRHLRIDSRLAPNGLVQVTVRDTGIGLDDVDLDRIFNPSYTRKSHGTGIGLSICRSVVAAHGGRLWVERNVGAGATFRFTLPVAIVGEETGVRS